MATTIDRLQIEINTQATKANTAIDNLITRLDRLTTSLGKINSSSINGLANGVDRLGKAMQTMNGVKTSDFTRLAKNISKMGSVNTQALNSTASSLSHITRAFNNLGSVSANSAQMAELAKSLSKLGGVNVQRAITNIPQLATALNNLMVTLSRSPRVSDNVIRLTNSLARLASQGGKVGTSSRSLQNSLNSTNIAVKKARVGFTGLASTIGRLYASYFWVKRIFDALKSSITSTADYIEAYNYFTVAFGKIASEWDSDWENYGSQNAQNYSNKFVTKMNETFKTLSGVSYDPKTGLLSETGLKNLGLNIQEVTQYAAQLGSMMNSVGQTGETTLATTQAFVRLAGDISSLYNIDYSTAASNIQSIMQGQSRVGYKYGWDTTVASLQALADEYDLSKPVSEMTQMEKQQLRILKILRDSRVAWGDQANTIGTLANQVRLLKGNFSQLGMSIGQLFSPIVTKILPVVNGLVIALRNLFLEMASFLGVSNKNIGAGFLQDDKENSEDLAENIESATDALKEYKNQLMGFDEINKLQEDKSSKNGVGGSIDLTDEILKATSEYEKIWQQAYDRMENDAEKWAKKIIKNFKNISKNLEPITKPIAQFSSTVLKDFYNGFLVPVGQWTMGEGIPNFINSIQDFTENLNWNLINKNLKNFWSILKNFTIGVGKGLLNFFDKYQRLSASLINGVSYAIEGFLALINLFPPSVIEAFGETIGALIGAFLLFKSMTMVRGVINGISLSFGTLLTTLTAHPIAALATSITSLGIVIYDFFNNPVEIGNGEIGDKFKGFSEDVEKAMNEAKNSIEDFNDSMTEITSKYDYIDEISDKYVELSNSYSTLTEEQKNLVQTYASIIKENVNGIEEYIDPITGAYTGTKEELDKLIQKTKEYYITLGAQQKMTEIGTQLAENRINLTEAVNELNEALVFKPNGAVESYLEWAERVYGDVAKFQTERKVGLGSTEITLHEINYKDVIDALERVNYRVETLTTSEREQVDVLYKYDEVFANYIDNLQNGANNVYGFTQVANELEGKMESLEDIVATNGETASDTANKAESAILKLDNATKNLGNTSSNVSSNISKTSTDFKYSMEDIKNSFLATISKFIPESNSVFSKLLSNFSTEGTNIGTSFGDSIGKGIMDGVGKNESSIFDKIKGIFSNISVETVTDTVSSGLALGFKVFGKIKGYSTGGFPEDGLFMANHNELVGQFSNGKPVVINNEQIIAGIEGGVERAVAGTLAPYLADIAESSRVTANKNFGITEKQVFNAVRSQHNKHLIQTGKNAFV